jgi:small subunit ribosomal protein S20
VANHVSAQKRARQTIKITLRNKHVRTTTRTLMKRVRAAVAEGDATRARSALTLAVRQIDKAVGKGVWHRNAGSRYISRLTAQVEALNTTASNLA